jgi:type VI secretion system protein ImpC
MAERASETQKAITPQDLADQDSTDQYQIALLKRLLHDSAFQRLEASWRGVDSLLRSTDPDPSIRFHILNIPRAALMHECGSNPETPKSSRVYGLLRDLCDGEDLSDFELILLDQHEYRFKPDEIEALDWLGRLVDSLGGSLLAAADPTFIQGDHKTDHARKAWHEYRLQTSAARTALFYPQVLLRLPYGSQTDPAHIDFEELDDQWSIDDLLWGNPAYAALIMMVRHTIQQSELDQAALLTDLPAYTYKSEGEYHLQPCTKKMLNETQIDELLQLGLVPVVGSKRRNTISIPWYQYIGTVSNRR